MDRRITLLHSFRHWTDCPQHGLQREYTVQLKPSLEGVKGFTFMLRECSVRLAIEAGEIDAPEGADVALAKAREG